MTALSTVRYVAACPACTHVAIWQATITGSLIRGAQQVDYRINAIERGRSEQANLPDAE